ncbi:hypothetical protein BN2497_11055 [Janthinobacterium sp. CG23_2]|nr:hypothetical protein BN2497_11055 [Janthinobacterium sp. CG23_2]CUU31925.1 hypothetical protein BN3177_11055 [Janthinobacterium sp. CG23_2]
MSKYHAACSCGQLGLIDDARRKISSQCRRRCLMFKVPPIMDFKPGIVDP